MTSSANSVEGVLAAASRIAATNQPLGVAAVLAELSRNQRFYGQRRSSKLYVPLTLAATLPTDAVLDSLLRGRWLYFVGDSTMRQLVEGLHTFAGYLPLPGQAALGQDDACRRSALWREQRDYAALLSCRDAKLRYEAGQLQLGRLSYAWKARTFDAAADVPLFEPWLRPLPAPPSPVRSLRRVAAARGVGVGSSPDIVVLNAGIHQFASEPGYTARGAEVIDTYLRAPARYQARWFASALNQTAELLLLVQRLRAVAAAAGRPPPCVVWKANNEAASASRRGSQRVAGPSAVPWLGCGLRAARTGLALTDDTSPRCSSRALLRLCPRRQPPRASQPAADPSPPRRRRRRHRPLARHARRQRRAAP